MFYFKRLLSGFGLLLGLWVPVVFVCLKGVLRLGSAPVH